MDKYQEFILRQVYHNSAIYTDKDVWSKMVNGFTSAKTGRKDCGVFDFEKDEIVINQDEDIFSDIYKHEINNYYREELVKSKIKRASFCDSIGREGWVTEYLSGVEVTRDGENWEKLVPDNDRYEIVLNFNDRIKKVKFCFVNGLADDYVMDVVYIEGDKEKYYREKAEEERQAFIGKAKIKVSVGANLVNIYFAPCGDNYQSTEIELFSGGNLIAKYKVPEEQFFKSIDGLAYGRYTFILKQFDKDGKIIFETDEKSFGIIEPHYGLPSV